MNKSFITFASMKKYLIVIFIIVVAILLTCSCATKPTCPTYANANNQRNAYNESKVWQTSDYCKPNVPYYIKKNRKNLKKNTK